MSASGGPVPSAANPWLITSPATGAQDTPARARPQVWWFGAHGGAGESTMSALLAGSVAGGHSWPAPAEAGRPAVPVVMLARTSMSGLRAAQEAAGHWAGGGAGTVDLLGLALLADAPGRRLPAFLQDLSELVAGGVPRLWRLPWVAAWRLQERPQLGADTPRPVHEFLNDVQALARLPAGDRGLL